MGFDTYGSAGKLHPRGGRNPLRRACGLPLEALSFGDSSALAGGEPVYPLAIASLATFESWTIRPWATVFDPTRLFRLADQNYLNRRIAQLRVQRPIVFALFLQLRKRRV
jgi:hypothetical protein